MRSLFELEELRRKDQKEDAELGMEGMLMLKVSPRAHYEKRY